MTLPEQWGAAQAEPDPLPFTPDCGAMQAHFNRVARTWQPPVQVAALGTWIAYRGYTACGSGVVVRYQGANTLVCPLTGESRKPYAALEYIPGRGEFRVRTDRCEVVPPRPRPVAAVAITPQPEAPRSGAPPAWLPTLLATGGALAGALLLAFGLRRAMTAGEPPRKVLEEEVTFLLSEGAEPLPPGPRDREP